MKKILFILLLILLSTNIYSLKLLEPIYKDLSVDNTANLGYFSADESFLISFLLEKGDDFTKISVDKSQEKDIIIEQTRNTKESIFTIIKINENIKGNYSLKINLLSETETKEVVLNMIVTDDVIHSQLINYNTDIFFENKEEIILNLINKSNTTKKVKIISDLPDSWFRYKKNIIPREIDVILPPNSNTEQRYYYFPKEIGFKEINLEVITNVEKSENIKSINYKLNVFVKKDLRSIYGSKEHTYPLFNFNAIPIYFLNKIIKMI